MQDPGFAHSVAASASTSKQPRFSGFSHLTIPCKDLAQSRRFFTEVLGGEIAHPGPKLEIRVGGILVTFSPASGGWTARDAEYPHYAFFIEADDFLPMKERLESYDVPTTEPWTRDQVKALMYFRDPSGNLFEMYCAQGFKGKLRHGDRAGGDYAIDFGALNYDWNPGSPRPRSGTEPRFSGFSHLTIPCKDLAQSRRFFTEVLGGEIAHPGPKLEIQVGGTLVTFSPASGGWTARDAEYPHYAFFIEADDFLPMKERLESYRVPTTEPWTRDQVKALMYFRDPSGNLFEMYCAQGFKGKLRHGSRAGGDYAIDFEALNYDWKY